MTLRRVARRLLTPRVASALRRTFPSLVFGHPGKRAIRRRNIPAAEATGRYDLVVFPMIEWFFLKQRPQQMALRFAGEGHRVFFVDIQSLRDGPWSNRRKNEAEATWVEEHIALVSRFAPSKIDPFHEVMTRSYVSEMAAAFEALRTRHRLDRAVCLVQLPFWAPLALRLKRELGWRVVYDWMDEHSGFPGSSPLMVAQEGRLLAESDLVVTTARALYERVPPGTKRLLNPNGCDFAHFNRAREPLEVPRDAAGWPAPVIGYHGFISSWFDMDLLVGAAKMRPGWTFVLIGGVHGSEFVRLPSNVHLIGPRPYNLLPRYLSRFDVACIPFKMNALIEAASPIKFFEYLSAGKPVVASPLRELRPFQNLFYVALDPESFVRGVESALTEVGSLASERVAVAADNTWDLRYADLRMAVDNLFDRAAP